MKPNPHRMRRSPPTARRQAGLVMYIALVVLIVMTLAGIAMMRQMGAGVAVAGNVAFKQNATSVADQGVEEAHAWYRTAGQDLTASDPTNGYYADWTLGFEPTAFDWTDAGSRLSMASADDPTRNEVRYVLQRLCVMEGLTTRPGQQCSDSGLNQSVDKGGAEAPTGESPPVPYFRVTVRVKGPRNTVSYVQVIMN